VTDDVGDQQDLLDRALGGDDSAFPDLVAPFQRSLFRHCYRMLGSGPDAEEAVQDAMLRAWRRLDTFGRDGSFGGWLYRIATNVCLDALRSRKARVGPADIGPPSAPGTWPGPPDLELVWVEPVGDVPAGEDPADEVMDREDISLAFVAALQRLEPRQRACLLLLDVLGFTQDEVSEALGITPGAVNSLVYRARRATRPRSDAPLVAPHDPRLRELLERYVRAFRLADIDAFVAVVADDVRLSMPPMTEWFSGSSSVAAFVEQAIFAAARPYGVTLVSGWCNDQPAFATYEPGPDGSLQVSGLQLLEVREFDGEARITDIASYRDPDLAVRCGLPSTPGGPVRP
jgi:RNA polymerase sigma-70 factor (ECF subfamily)